MKWRLLLILFLWSIQHAILAQDQLSAEAYKQAESQLSFNTSPYIDRMNVRPYWESDEKFWYRNLIEDGLEFVHYDIKEKKKLTFDSKGELDEIVKKKTQTPTYTRRKEVISPDKTKVVFIK